QCPDVHIAKTADQSSVSAGDQIGFTITVTNIGAGTATNVQVSDSLPGNPGLSWSLSPPNSPAGCSITGAVGAQTLSCQLGDLAPGGSVAIHIVSPTTVQSCGTITNVASETTGNDGSD